MSIGPADHYVTCQISTQDGGGKILRASQFDSDFDGLFDHWEEIGGGVDVDKDGIPELVLQDFGANPYRKDLFIEIDWSVPWRPEPFTDANGNGVLAGTIFESYRAMPGNSIIIGLGGVTGRLTESGRIPVIFPNPAAPNDISVPPGFLHYQLLYHEPGHTLSLMHGGADNVTRLGNLTPKPEYLSIMNYGYVEFPDRNGVLIRDYSSDPSTYNDWANARLDTARYFDALNGHFVGGRYQGGRPDRHHHSDGRTMKNLEKFIGPLHPPERAVTTLIEGSPGDSNDQDRDGLPLLVEEAFGTDPAVPDRHLYPVKADVAQGPGGRAHRLRFPPNTASGILYVVERSGNLVDWTSEGITETVTGTQGAVQNIEATFPAGTSPGSMFFRIRLTRQP